MRSKLLSSAGAILVAVAALTACSTGGNTTTPPPATPSPVTDMDGNETGGGESGGARVDPRRFQAVMTECMAEEGWTVVSAPDGAVSPANEADSAVPAFNEAIVTCMEEAAPPLE